MSLCFEQLNQFILTNDFTVIKWLFYLLTNYVSGYHLVWFVAQSVYIIVDHRCKIFAKRENDFEEKKQKKKKKKKG